MSKILNDYCKFGRLAGTKSKNRMDCITGTKSNPEFEVMRNKKGELFVYLTDVPEQFIADVKRKADMCISHTKNISSIFIPDVSLPFAYGDIKGTQDAILFILNVEYTGENKEIIKEGSFIELFIARGQRSNRLSLYTMFADGELDTEISELRAAAVTESVTKKNE